MSNINDARGFRAIKDGTIEYHTKQYAKDPTVSIFMGDLVTIKLVSGRKVVTPFVAGDGKVLGVAAHTVLSTDAVNNVINVYDSPDYSYRVQINTFAQGQEFLNADIAAPVAKTGAALLLEHSNMSLASSTLADTADLPLKVLGLAKAQDQDLNVYGAHADVVVKINNHILGTGDGATGIA